MTLQYPFLLSIPHSGEVIPPEVQDRVAITRRDILYTGDPLTRRIYGFEGRVAACIATDIARVIVDMNRAPYYAPFMNPDGIVKRVTSEGVPVYREGLYPDRNLILTLLKRYYYPYHQSLDAALDAGGVRLAFDCHSMLPYPPPLSTEPPGPRPLFCLSNGGDEKGRPTRHGTVTCPPELLAALADAFRDAFGGEGEIALNKPFRGGFISQAHYRHRRIPWVQIEMNRRLYEDDASSDLATVQPDEAVIRGLRKRIFSALEQFWQSLPEEAGTGVQDAAHGRGGG
ncbi:N-formylglutamate amidohydrolase [Methanoculleus sp. FWC-SCC1]|uniref:N-formylglutamate amidohydrolase n=1 Tax=Methanoculleus frigidifontis TaxID=2584085 RepID=A0ABT8M651_9EURY|nr:N-formylglutamate amidohydrolase [Methanoculleus sp. FWC-SCC1]MDN7023412.1 N-formylglutamate amidohydrolase [Methanoculleus sp. FWC-SCC1]